MEHERSLLYRDPFRSARDEDLLKHLARRRQWRNCQIYRHSWLPEVYENCTCLELIIIFVRLCHWCSLRYRHQRSTLLWSISLNYSLFASGKGSHTTSMTSTWITCTTTRYIMIAMLTFDHVDVQLGQQNLKSWPAINIGLGQVGPCIGITLPQLHKASPWYYPVFSQTFRTCWFWRTCYDVRVVFPLRNSHPLHLTSVWKADSLGAKTWRWIPCQAQRSDKSFRRSRLLQRKHLGED